MDILLFSIFYEEEKISSKNLLYAWPILNSGDYKKLSMLVKSIFPVETSLLQRINLFHLGQTTYAPLLKIK